MAQVLDAEPPTVADERRAGPGSSVPIDHTKPIAPFDYAALLRRVARTAGKGAWAQTLEMWRLFMAEGGITPFDYYYGLYDTRPDAEKRAFVGSRLRTRVTNKVLDNYFYGVGLDKITFYACMTGLGLPVPRTRALFHPTRMLAGAEHLSSRERFEDYLRNPAHYPSFCKPAEQTGSLGAASLDRYDPQGDALELATGNRVPVAHFVDEAARYLDNGYLVQERLCPHPEIGSVTAPRASTVRMMVLQDGGTPRVIRATWRVPAGENISDVLWRGNLMAALDPESGTVERMIKGFGPDLVETDTHPDTGKMLLGYCLPMWTQARELALLAAAALPKLELTGWDVSITDRGPLLVELEPDGGEPTVTQLASGKGLLDGPYGEFVRKRFAKQRTGNSVDR